MKILWVSRHEITEEQITDLERIYEGEVEIKRLNKSIKGFEEILEAGEDCDVLAVVLPPQLIMDLVNPRNNLKPVIRSIMNRIETGETEINTDTGNVEKIYRSEFVAWERINRFIVDVTRL